MRRLIALRTVHARILSVVFYLAFLLSATVSPCLLPAQPQETDSTSASKQCGEYVEAYRNGPAGYAPFLKYTARAAQTRDKQETTSRYSHALADSAPSANALWLKNWCEKNPLKGYAYASTLLLDELTGKPEPAKPEAAKPDPPDPILQILPQIFGAPRAPANSCKVGSTKFCSGCSVACGEGERPSCQQGSDFFNEKCAFQSRCSCIPQKKS